MNSSLEAGQGSQKHLGRVVAHIWVLTHRKAWLATNLTVAMPQLYSWDRVLLCPRTLWFRRNNIFLKSPQGTIFLPIKTK